MIKTIKILILVCVLLMAGYFGFKYWAISCVYPLFPQKIGVRAQYSDETIEEYRANIQSNPAKEKEQFYNIRPSWCNYFDLNKNA